MDVLEKIDLYLERSDTFNKQAGVVMKTFHKGELRKKGGERVTNEKQAKAIAASEGRTADKRGRSRREYMGNTRMRPKLKEKK